MPIRFALNRTCAPHLPLDVFIALARAAGAEAVEIRTDVADRDLLRGSSAEALRDRLEASGLWVASVNALQRFNDWTPEREREARTLIALAARLGAPGLVLCPAVDGGPARSDADLARNLRQGLQGLRPILADHHVLGYVEPLGLKGSTLQRQACAVEAIAGIDGWDAFALCHDTFEFFRCNDDRAFPEHVGLVHVSGIARHDRPPVELTEPDRGLVLPNDRTGSVAQLRALIAGGYDGVVSMEPFSPDAQRDPRIAQALRESLDHIATALAARLH